MSPPPNTGFRACIAACAMLFTLVLAAQWDPKLRAELLEQVHPTRVDQQQLHLHLQLASTWMLSAKAGPYLARADSLLRACEAMGDTADAPSLAHARAMLHYMYGYQAKFKRDVPTALGEFRRSDEALAVHGTSVRVHDAIGTLYRSVGRPDLAIRSFEQGIVAAERNKDVQSWWAQTIEMAGAYIDKGDLGRATQLLAQCDTTVDGVQVMHLRERAHLAEVEGDTAQAMAYWHRALARATPPPDHWQCLAPLSALARLHLAGARYQQAMFFADSCAAAALHTGDEAVWCGCTVLGAQARLATGRRGEAERSFRMALDTARYYGYIGLSRTIGDDGSMVRAAELLKELYQTEGRWKEAAAMATYWSALKDTLNAKDGRMEVLRAEMQRAALADSLGLVRQAEEERCVFDARLVREADQRRSLKRTAIVGAVGLVLLALLLWQRLKQARRLAQKDKQLHDQQVDELMRDQEIKAMHAMFEGQEKERDRVARDLHDRVGSMLGNVKLQMEVLEERMGTDRAERDGQYRKVYGLLQETVSEVRRISHDMVAGTLARFGLEKALEGLCTSVRVSGRLAVELRVFGLDQRLERGMEVAVYRIVQELVGNVLKHADATEVTIDLTRSPGRLSVMVSDDGHGFDPAAAADGIGLANVRQRAATLGGVLVVDSTLGKGTTASLEFPVVE